MTAKKIAIVVSKFNSEITGNLLRCAKDTLVKNGVTSAKINVKWVPGAYELPYAALQLARSKRYAGVIGLGCVIKGETSHDLHVASWASLGLGLVSLLTNVPTFFGVLTPNNEKQARVRSKPGPLNRGGEVAIALLETLGWVKG
jgi:6,7-dimethyl-8-ribityllumazine synthase